jgi:predicted transcriptional regulator
MTSNRVRDPEDGDHGPSRWMFLTNHGRALLCIANDPEVRLRDIAATVGITERRAYGIVNDLAQAGYVVKEKEGRRNRYHVQHHLPLPESREQAIGDVLDVLTGKKTKTRAKAKTKAMAKSQAAGRVGRRSTDRPYY